MIKVNHFHGMVPRLDNTLLGESHAELAQNCTLEEGILKPISSIPSWSTHSAELQSIVDGRKYKLVGGVLYEDSRPIAVDIPSSPGTEVKKLFDMSNAVFGLSQNWNFGATKNTLYASASLNVQTKTYHAIFTKQGSAVLATGAVVGGIPSTDNCSLVYNGKEYELPVPVAPITIYDDSMGIYGTIFVEDVSISTSTYTPPAGTQYNWKMDTVTADVELVFVSNVRYRYYACTFVDDRDNEGPPSDISGACVSCKGDKITLKIPFDETEHPYVEKVRIYRTAGSASTMDFYFVEEVAATVYTPSSGDEESEEEPCIEFVDTIQDYMLQEKMPRHENPPTGLSNLVMINNALAASKGAEVWFSEPFIENNWPADYMQTCENTVTKLAVTGITLFAFTTKYIELFRGSHPSSMVHQKLESPEYCVSADSVVVYDNMVYYASNNGLIVMDTNGNTKNLTQNFFTQSQWAALGPSGLKLIINNNKIYMYFASAKYIIELLPEGPELIKVDEETLGTLKWISKKFVEEKPLRYTMARSTAASPDSTEYCTIRAGGYSCAVPMSLPNCRPVRMANMFAREWQFVVNSTKNVYSVELAESSMMIH